MSKKRGTEYENEKPGIGFNTILTDEKSYGWKKKNCARRHCDEWLKERKAISEAHRPSTANDEGWERKCFDFFEPLYLVGHIDNLLGGKKALIGGSHGSQADILFNFQAFNKDCSKIVTYKVIGEAKNTDNVHIAYEDALSQLHERELEAKKLFNEEIILPIVFFKGERQALKQPGDARLVDIDQRAIKVWENDIDFYVLQAIDLGWEKTWKLFLLEVLNIRYGFDGDVTLPALKFKIKEKTAFSVFMPSSYALNVCHVERVHKKAPHGVYQRALDPKRVKEIADDLQNPSSLNTCFPNSIVASFDPQITNSLETIWVKHSETKNAEIGLLKLPNIYGLIKIIDGQHRLFAHDLLSTEIKNYYGMPFTIMWDLKPWEEMVLFKSINTTAEEVNENLVDIILYLMKDTRTDRGLASSLVCTLAFEDEEWQELFGHIGTGITDFDFGKTGIKIKIDNLVKALVNSGLIKDNEKGELNPKEIEDKITYGCSVIKKFIELMKIKLKGAWGTDWWKEYFRTRPGIRLMLLSLSYWMAKKHLSGNPVDKLKLEELVEKIYDSRQLIKNKFDETRGAGRGEEFLKSIVKEII